MKNFIGLLLLLASSTNTYAGLVTYIIDGNLSLNSGPDSYNLNGASFSYRIVADTTRSPSSTPSSNQAYYAWESATLAISSRPNGLPDIESVALGYYSEWQMETLNKDQSLTFNPDNFFLQRAWFPVLGNFLIGSVTFQMASDYFSGSGIVPLPSTIDTSDLTNIFAGAWGCNGCSGQYLASNISITTVPVPAAAWLFGSALGILALYRRFERMTRVLTTS